MKKNYLLVLMVVIVAFGHAQEVRPCLNEKPLINIQEKSLSSNTSKAYGNVIWSENFDAVKWKSTVVADENGYKLDPAANLPEGWKIIDNNGLDYFWHWSNVGPRGAYASGNDSDPFTPWTDEEVKNVLPAGTSVENGYLMLESDYFNTNQLGNISSDPIEMDAILQYGPLDFSSLEGVIFNIKTLYRYCCSSDAMIGLEISDDYNPVDGSGDWTVIPLNVITNGNEITRTSERDMHINVSKYVAGKSAVYFRLRQTYASHYFWIVDDVNFYVPPANDIVLKDGWADYIYDAENIDFKVSNTESNNFWGGYTEIPKSVVGEFVKFRAGVEVNGTKDAENATATIQILKDDVVDGTFTSIPQTVWSLTNDTLIVEAHYTPAAVGHYQVSMTVSMKQDDENFEDNEWMYEFDVINGERYSRVRHGHEDEFDQAGPSDWAIGGLDGDVCVQRFTFPESAESVKLKGISVYIDDYTDRDSEIAAIKSGEFTMIARVYKIDSDGNMIETIISSSLYTLVIQDTATWLTLDFIDEGNLVLPAGLYYAGIEVYTGNADYRFQIGADNNGIKQPDAGGMVYLVNNGAWYRSGDNYAIDLNLENITYDASIVDTICGGDVFIFGSQNITTSGKYFETFESSLGEDSLVRLDLWVNPTYDILDNIFICQGEAYFFGSVELTESGEYTETFKTIKGCDSIVTLTLTVNPEYTQIIDASICRGDIYYVGDLPLEEPGQYKKSLISSTGCDSTVTINLSFYPDYSETFEVGICRGESYQFGQQIITEAGYYVDTFPTINGCDSMVTINLSYYQEYSETFDVSICNGGSYQFGEQVISDEGYYVDTFATINGCDSMVTINLSLYPNYNEKETASICDGGEYIFGNQVLKESGEYTEVFKSVYGCDSTVSLTLELLPNYNDSLDVAICQGDSIQFGSEVLKEPGDYVEVFESINGCDSTVFLTLSYNPVFNETDEAVICKGEFYDFGNQRLTTSGDYEEVFQSILGCDSIVTLSLRVDEVDVDVIQDRENLTATLDDANYQWVICGASFMTIANETNQNFVAKSNGYYAVIVNQNNCTDTSDCYAVSTIAINDSKKEKTVALYPNPTNGTITIDTKELYGEMQVSIYNAVGQRVYNNSFYNKRLLKLNLSHLPKGVYSIKLQSGSMIMNYQIIRE